MAMTTSMMLRTARQAIQKRPILSLSTASLVLSSSYVYRVENQTDQYCLRRERERGQDRIDARTKTTQETEEEDFVVDLPHHYDRDAIFQYWNHRPLSVLSRLGGILAELCPLVFAYTRDFKILSSDSTTEENCSSRNELYTQHAYELRQALTRLGPAFIKLGQQLSIRPDLLPPPVLMELQKLCDAVEPVPDEIAMQTIRSELGADVLDDSDHNAGPGSKLIHLKLVASASLGQVYKATKIDPPTKDGKSKSTSTKEYTRQEVAIKVQRPDMIRRVSLDLYLLNHYGQILDTLFDIFTNQIPFHVNFINCFAKGSYEELDYLKEASNQTYFRDEFAKRKCKVHIPSVHNDLTSRRVITMDWVDGTKLADARKDHLKKLIPVGVELFLTQLLDIGTFHSDPHPGNLYVTSSGTLCLLDFGLCADIDARSRQAMTTAIVHLLNGDFDSLIARDAKDLGFLPDDLDITELQPILTKILTEGLLESGSNLQTRKRKLMNISNELNEVFFRYPFSVPPFFALITRGLGLLEGIALSGDPEFDIFKASYPYASRRAAEIYGAHSWYNFRRRISNYDAGSSPNGKEEAM